MKHFILSVLICMSSIVFSQTIGGIAISKGGVEFCMGSLQDNMSYISTDVKFPLNPLSIGYMNIGLGYAFTNNIVSLKGGLYSLQKYEPIKMQYGIEYLRQFRTFNVGISYLSQSKLSVKLLFNLE